MKPMKVEVTPSQPHRTAKEEILPILALSSNGDPWLAFRRDQGFAALRLGSIIALHYPHLESAMHGLTVAPPGFRVTLSND